MSRGPYPMMLMLAMSLPGAARALGLGDIRIESALNEPLSAQIDIVGATRDELAALTASVANRDIFQRYGADRPSFLSSATFKVGLDGHGRPVLNVRSAEAFSDPLVSFIVDLRWGKSEVVREYSLLLDPPGYATPHTAPAVQMAASPATPAAPLGTQAARSAADPAGRTLHRVLAGETLHAVARQAGARTELPTQRLMIAIFRANPGAFDGNINRLHRDALLSIPTAADLDAISDVDAKREVRAHMTAWRLDVRPYPAHRTAPASVAPALAAISAVPAVPVVAAAVTPPDAAPAAAADAALKARVASLEHSLNDMHQQLATENANLRSLEDVVAPPKVASAELGHLPIIAAAHAGSVSHAAAAGSAQTGNPSNISNTSYWLAPLALCAGLLLAGFAYLRKRSAFASPSPANPALVPVKPVAAAAAILKKSPGVDAAPPALLALPSQLAATARHPVVQAPERGHADNTTISLEIDIEALESSYLDTLAVDGAAIASAAVATSDVDTAVIDAEFTAEHVDMPSGLHERPTIGERRLHMADVLKSAIEKNPQRSDLRMKLLETYYSAAATNQRAFIDLVRKLSREPGGLSREEWEKVNIMGREIAADDILFAGVPKDGDLAVCA